MAFWKENDMKRFGMLLPSAALAASSLLRPWAVLAVATLAALVAATWAVLAAAAWAA